MAEAALKYDKSFVARTYMRIPICLLAFILEVALPKANCQASNLPIFPVYIQNFAVDDYNASCQNWGISIASHGKLYVANNTGLLVFDGNSWSVYRLPDNSALSDVTYHADTVYTKGESSLGAWTSDEYGRFSYHPLNRLPDGVRFIDPVSEIPDWLPDEIMRSSPSAYAVSERYCFIGTLTNGLYITDRQGAVLKHLTISNQLQDNMVRAIDIQDENSIWVAFDNGISQITLNPSISLIAKRSEIGKLTNAAFVGDSLLYMETNVGYYTQLLSTGEICSIPSGAIPGDLFPEKSSSDIPANQLLKNSADLEPFSDASRSYQAYDNFYWLIAENQAGLFYRDEQDVGTLKCRILFKNYGMNIVSKDKCVFYLNDSLSLISAMQGVLLINIREFIKNDLGEQEPIKLTRLAYVDKKGKHDLPLSLRKISLPHDFQELSIYAGTSIFTANHQMSYKIEGVSLGWSEWQQDGKISFLQLPEGSYLMRIRRYTTQGPFPEIMLSIEVRPAWYNTLWAWGVYILLGWALLHFGLRFQLRKLHDEEQDRERRALEVERQRMLSLKHELLEAELRSKQSELALQTTALVKKNQSMGVLLDELDQQKQTMGERYPNRLYNRMRGLMEETLNNQADWISFETYFNSAHQDFLNRINLRYEDLTTGDLRICCLLRMNLSTKEIASLLNISVRAVELRRYRLRKRLNLENETNLVDFLMKY